MIDSQRGRIARSIDKFKLGIADLLNLHEEPVFVCPVSGCDETANYGREIWSHCVNEHHDRVITDE